MSARRFTHLQHWMDKRRPHGRWRRQGLRSVRVSWLLLAPRVVCSGLNTYLIFYRTCRATVGSATAFAWHHVLAEGSSQLEVEVDKQWGSQGGLRRRSLRTHHPCPLT